MKQLILIVNLITISFLISCKKEDQKSVIASTTYIVVGESYTFFPVEEEANFSNAKLACIAPPLMLKWEGDSLIKDLSLSRALPNEIYDGFSITESIDCPDSVKEKMNQLIDKVPTELFNEHNSIISTTKRLDGYYIYLELKDESGNRRFWLLNGDRDKNNLPPYLHSFMDDCHALIDFLHIIK